MGRSRDGTESRVSLDGNEGPFLGHSEVNSSGNLPGWSRQFGPRVSHSCNSHCNSFMGPPDQTLIKNLSWALEVKHQYVSCSVHELGVCYSLVLWYSPPREKRKSHSENTSWYPVFSQLHSAAIIAPNT